MSGLGEVLAGHRVRWQRQGWATCRCGKWSMIRGSEGEHHTAVRRAHDAHVEAAVLAWLRGELASAEVVEAVRDAIYPDRAQYGIDMREAAEAYGDAALAAVRDAFGIKP